MNATGCIHTEILVLIINSSTSNSTTHTACDSYTWSVNGTTYTTSGTYTDVSTNATGCTHTETLVLTINSSTSNSTIVTDCDSYTWAVNGATYTTSGTYTDVSTNASGCTHTETLVLTINSFTSSSITVTHCDSYTWPINGVTYNTSVVDTVLSLNTSGCADTNILELTINYSTNTVDTIVECDSYTWPINGVTYNTSVVDTVLSLNTSGCIEINIINLTINYSTHTTDTIVACDSYIWPINGLGYYTSGIYGYIDTNAAGCLDTNILKLTINHSTTTTDTIVECDSYIWNGTTYDTSGVYTYSTTNAVGCDSIAILNLTITNRSTSFSTCNRMRFFLYLEWNYVRYIRNIYMAWYKCCRM